MKLSAIFISLAFAVPTMADWEYSSSGEFHSCDSGEFIVGLCGSGKHGKCGPNEDMQNAYECASYPSNNTYPASEEGGLSDKQWSDWTCYDKTDTRLVSCPPGQAMVGVCSSGGSAKCKQYCGGDKNYPFAIQCAPAPSNKDPVKFMGSEDGWKMPSEQNNGQNFECPSGEVACGACFGDADTNDCGGYSFAVRCCPTGPFDVTGKWISRFGITTKSQYCIDVGVEKSSEQSYAKTETWTESVTNKASAGYKASGASVSDTVTLSASQSQSITNEYKSDWSVNVTRSVCYDFNQADIGMWLFQWVTQVTDNTGNSQYGTYPCVSETYALMPNKYTPPECLPGGYETSDKYTGGNYSSCHDGYYLPGYGEGSGQRVLARSSLRGSRRIGN